MAELGVDEVDDGEDDRVDVEAVAGGAAREDLSAPPDEGADPILLGTPGGGGALLENPATPPPIPAPPTIAFEAANPFTAKEADPPVSFCTMT